jgi:predicted secreted protein
VPTLAPTLYNMSAPSDPEQLALWVAQVMNSDVGHVIQSIMDKQIQDFEARAQEREASLRAENQHLAEQLMCARLLFRFI